MYKKFVKYLRKYQLLQSNDKILLTVSGGADSVVMAHLFSISEYKFDIAHCNFKLRGNDSDEDENFVKRLSEKYKVKCYVNNCDAKQYSVEKNISIEMAARELRYNWFEKIANENSYNKIATAHHLNDSVETILLNISKKTGMRGLLGIPKKHDKIIRPLLFASKKEILDYCEKNSLEYRIDKTNFETEFQRNKIRNIIIPEFEKINNAFSNNVYKTSQNIEQYFEFFKIHLKKFVAECVTKDKYGIEIDLIKLEKFKPKRLFLFEFLRDYGFNSSQIDDIIGLNKKSSGKIFQSKEFNISIDRQKLFLYKNEEKLEEKIILNTDGNNIQKINKNKFDELNIKIEIEDSVNYKINRNRNFANLDYYKLKFPLILRKWQNGDFFYPIGLQGKKKLSDYFSDNKFSRKDKQKTWILESNGEIVWLVNHRIDRRFQIQKDTRKILLLSTL